MRASQELQSPPHAGKGLKSPGISVLILTLNEEANLPLCLESVAWSDDIVVFDSFSSDRTVEIARAFGARVVQRAFDNELNQRQAALRLEFKHPWVYNPDADEITPSDLRDEMLAAAGDPTNAIAAYRVRFKTMFMGRWIRRSSLYPTWVVRLFRPERVSFAREINLTYHIDGPTGQLQSHFLHYTFRKGLTDWFAKHNRYSTGEAVELLKAPAIRWRDIFSPSPVRRRASLKNLAYRMPGRPLLTFLYLYVARAGFLDGQAGLRYCILRCIYEFLIDAKAAELRRQQRQAPSARKKCPEDHPFSVGIGQWFARHNESSSLEAMRRAGKSRVPPGSNMACSVVSGWPLLTFLWLYFGRLQVLHGRAGFIHSALCAVNEYMINLKVLELRLQEKGQSI